MVKIKLSNRTVIKNSLSFSLLPFILLLSTFSPLDTLGNQEISVDQAKIRVVTTLSILEDFVSSLVGDAAEVTSLVSGLEDPHSYEPTSSDLLALSGADLIVAMGVPRLESWLTSYLEDNPERKAKTIFAGNITTMGKFDPLLGEVNDHIWMDPNNALAMATTISRGLVSIAGMDNETVSENIAKFRQQINALLNRIDELRGEFNGTKVVVDHPAFFYLLDLLGFVRIAIIETKEGSEPSAYDIANIIQLMKRENVSLIVESYQQAKAKTVEEIAMETGAKIATLSPLLGVENVETYIDLINFDLDALQNPRQVTQKGMLSVYLTYLLFGPLALALVVMYRRRVLRR